MRAGSWWWWSWLGWLASPAAAAPLPEVAYQRAVDLVDRLYLEPERLDARLLLRGGAERLAEDLHWLVVRDLDGTLALSHGDGTPLGTVEAGSMGALAGALLQLERTVVGAGRDLDGVDVRLSLLEGLTEALDRNSRILAGDQQWRFSLRLKGEYIGIGATLHREVGGLVVADLQEKEPAELAGLAVDDLVLRIDGHSTVNMPEEEAARLIQGREGTQVTLTVRRGDPPRELRIPVVRARVVEPNVLWRVLPDDVGYVQITHISQRTVYNLRRKLDRLREKGALAKGLVIDLRGNTGGSMQEAALSADLFVDDGLLLRTDGPDGGRVQSLEREMWATRAPPGAEIDVPLMLVVDDRTASGAEILAGALVELGRAATIGTRTYGKGTVQKLYDLTDDDSVQLKLTVAEYVLANERHIAGDAIVPDVVVGQVWLDGNGVRFTHFDEVAERTPWSRILPELEERPGWRGAVVPEVDLPLEIARASVLGASGPGRASVLQALERAAGTARAEQLEALTAALGHRQIDWRPAEEEGTFVNAEVVVRARPVPDAPTDVVSLEVEVENRGEDPLARALVELGCPTFATWDGLVVPVGFVGPGARARGAVTVPLPPGVEPRQDSVSVRLRADRVAPLDAGERILSARSLEIPRVALRARLAPHAGEDVFRAEVTVANLADHPVTGVEVSFAYPRELGVELLDPVAVIPVLPAKEERRVDLAIRLGPGAPPVLETEVLVRSERFDTLAHWPLRLARDGSVAVLQEPTIGVRGDLSLSAPAGSTTVPLVVTDDTAVDHVVVFAGRDKVAWVAGGRPRVAVEVPFELSVGVNQLRVIAEDEDGVAAERTLVIRGEPPAVVVAGE